MRREIGGFPGARGGSVWHMSTMRNAANRDWNILCRCNRGGDDLLHMPRFLSLYTLSYSSSTSAVQLNLTTASCPSAPS